MQEHATAPNSSATTTSPNNRRKPSRKPTPPTLSEQFFGIFTEPKILFRKLSDAPSWGQALGTMIGFGILLVIVWGLKVDADSIQRRILEQNQQITPSQIDHAIEVYRRLIIPIGIFGVIFRSLFGVLTLALLFFLAGLGLEEGRKRTYLHAVSAATVPNLVMVPYTILITILCAVRNVGGSIPERLAPSGLAYYIQPENPKLYALLAQVDPFIMGYFAMLYLAVRHTMRMKPIGALLCTVFSMVIIVGSKVYFWV